MLKYKSLAPYLTIYKSENSSLFSIWHRITGVINLFILFSISLLVKLFIWGIMYSKFYKFLLLYKQYIFTLLFISFLYHMLNGYRHILWDINKFLTVLWIRKTSYLLLVTLNIILITWILSL